MRQAAQRIRARLVTMARRTPLRWRLTLASLGLLSALMLGLGLLVSVIEESALLRNESNQLYNQARHVAPSVGDHNGPDGQPNLVNGQVYLWTDYAAPPSVGQPSSGFILSSAALVQELSGPTTVVSVLSTSGTPIVQTEKSAFLGSVVADKQAITNTLAEPRNPRDFTLATDAYGQRQLLVLLPMVQNGHTVGLLQLSASTRQIDDAVTTTRIIVFSGIGGCLILAGLLSWPLMGAALRPLAEMEAGTERIASGDLTFRLKEPEADDEIGSLTRAFNVMVAQVEGAFSRQRRFVADVSHELRTPLTALGGGLEMLLMGADQGDPAAGRRLLRGMYAETERMRHLVEELLTLARLDEGRAHLHLESVDAGETLRAVAEQARALAHGQRIELEVAPSLPPARADAERLRQVLLSLLDNALKYTPPTGQITLVARYAGEMADSSWVAFDVRDTGVGIPADALPHVFDRFYRVDPARARTGERADERKSGSGLGLAIARGLVEAQGGSIAITSAVGEGTTVTVELPAWRPEDVTLSPAPELSPLTPESVAAPE